MRYLAAAVVIAAGLAAAYFVLGNSESGIESAPGGNGGAAFAIPVEAVPVKMATLIRTVPAVGTLRSSESLTLRPEIAGRITSFHFQEGQSVEADAILVRLDDAIARSEVAEARASLTYSQQAYERASRLFKEKVGTAKAQDEALSALRVDEARVAVAESRLAKTIIRAPFQGIVGLRQVSPGDYIDAGRNIVNLEQIEVLKVDFRVPELELPNVAVGQRVGITVDALPGKSFAGEVYAIDPAIDPQGRSIALRAQIDNPGLLLRPGMFARIALETGRSENAALVPEEAIVPAGSDRFVFRVVDGTAAMTKVAIGQRRRGEVHVTEGLGPGDQVVVAGQIKLQDGMPVTVVPGPSSDGMQQLSAPSSDTRPGVTTGTP